MWSERSAAVRSRDAARRAGPATGAAAGAAGAGQRPGARDEPPVIRAESLGKRYRIAPVRDRPDTLRDAIAGSVRRAARTLRGRRPRRRPPRTIWALRDVSFELGRGEVLGIIGSNGAGKSTLLKLLAQITKPTTGRAAIRGRVGSLLEVGTGFHAELTGRENIYLSGAVLGMRRHEIDRKFDRIVAFAEVDEFIDTPVKHYSSGMYLRLAFAVAAHLEPEILIVDEVLAVGDAEFQRKCLGKMDAVATEGRTVLFVSHDMDAIRRLCSRCMLLDDGRVAAAGATARVVADYLSRSLGKARPGRTIELDGRPRKGSGAARFRCARLHAGDERAGGHPYPNGPLHVELEIESDAARSVESMALSVCTFGGTKLINTDIIALGEPLRLRRGANRVRLRIDALPLNPGRYTGSLWLGDALDTTYDYVEEAFEFEVVPAPAGRLGATPADDGLVPCDFELQQPA